jgi:uncharacterized protein (TIGR03435 family)
VNHQPTSALAALAVAAGCLSSISESRAQVPTEKKPLTFEVASVRPGKPGAIGFGLPGPMPGGQRYVATKSPLLVMVMKAYSLTDSQIQGAPKWMIFDPWDVEAKAEHPSTPEQLQEMFQSLLAERFKLRLHRETKEAAAFVLNVDKSGSKLKPSNSKEPSDTPIKPGDSPGERVGTAVSMSYLCWYLNFTFDAPIVNQTGLDGLYDFTLELPPPSPLLQPQETPRPAPADDVLDRNAEMISALSQIGLKLERRKATVDIFIVDHVERPSEN